MKFFTTILVAALTATAMAAPTRRQTEASASDIEAAVSSALAGYDLSQRDVQLDARAKGGALSAVGAALSAAGKASGLIPLIAVGDGLSAAGKNNGNANTATAATAATTANTNTTAAGTKANKAGKAAKANN